MEDLTTLKREQYLDKVVGIWNDMEEVRDMATEQLNALKQKFAETLEEGKLEADLQMTAVANECGVSRQSVHKIVKHVFGIRYYDKSAAAKIGHENRRKAQESE